VCTDFLSKNPLTQSFDTSTPDVCMPTAANKSVCKNIQ
jgi:hypothetical protein